MIVILINKGIYKLFPINKKLLNPYLINSGEYRKFERKKNLLVVTENPEKNKL